MESSLPLLYYKLKERGFFGKPKNRPLLSEVLEIINKNLVDNSPPLIFVQLPPGYGKTSVPFSLALWAILDEEAPIERSIHVLPLRSIVEDVNGRFSGYGRNVREKSVGLKTLGISKEDTESIAGAQCMFVHGSPFLQKNGFISTTLDTFALLACKLPTLEISKIAHGGNGPYGHYEIARGAILSSISIFDEAHLFFEEHEGFGRASEALIALMIALLVWRVPLIVMTATLSDSLRREIMGWIREYVPDVKFNVFEYNREGKVDRDFENEIRSVNLKTEFEKDDEKYITSIHEAWNSYNRVLVVANTIRRSVELFDKLKNKGIEPILLHSKFTQEDRTIKLEKLKSSRWLCISTQVIEAGVDISSDILFTDIAPICSMVQRAGRCCRPSHIDSGIGKVVVCVSKEGINAAKRIYDENKIKITYGALNNISETFHWHSYLDYYPLIDKIYSESSHFRLGSIFSSMLNIFENPYYESTDALNSLLELGSFTRDSVMIPAIVCEKDEIRSLEDLRDRLNSLIPIEKNDLEMIWKKSEVGILFRKNNNRIEEKPLSGKVMKNIIEYMITGEVYACRIPGKFYDGERGLKL